MSIENFCTICGQPSSLEDCKTDDKGHVVHEICYAAKLAGPEEKKVSSPQRQNRPVEPDRLAL